MMDESYLALQGLRRARVYQAVRFGGDWRDPGVQAGLAALVDPGVHPVLKYDNVINCIMAVAQKYNPHLAP